MLQLVDEIYNTGIFDSLLVLIFGIIYYFFQPKNPNTWYGYRTPRSMKNKKNWIYANKIAAKTFIGLGLFALFSTSIVERFTQWNSHSIFMILFVLTMIFMLIYIEIVLKKRSNTI